ncbi:MAG: transcriptional regulator [Chitinophagaceae bacterium]|nr:MAG: transcriptional regulator [Chitinophagaceae bacterium]
MRPGTLFLLLMLMALTGSGQSTIGLPEVRNYTKGTYRAGTQSWMIRQDSLGILYFANNDGLLTYDGAWWKTYPLPNKTIVRSVAIGPKGRIYVGGQDELGYFAPEANGALRYHSLKDRIPVADRSFADVWNIVAYGNSLFFRTSDKIFQFTGDQVTVAHSTDWRFMAECNGQLLVQDNPRGLLRFRNGLWEPLLPGAEYPKDLLVTGLLPFGRDTMLMTSFRHGSFLITGGRLVPFETPDLKTIAGRLIYTAVRADADHYLLGTTLDGCYIIDRRGTITQSFTRREGLQNNNILSVFFDHDRNLWIGLDNGIDFITYDSPVRHIYPSPQNEGSGYTSMVFGNRLYIGTSNGLYDVPLDGSRDISYGKGGFRPVANAQGQVWNLSEVNGRLLMGHHEGAFEVLGDAARRLAGGTGYWGFYPYANVLPSELVVAGTYNGIRVLNYRNAAFSLREEAAYFESARFISIDNNDRTIWVAHPYKGIYRVRFDGGMQPLVRRYASGDGLLSINNNYIFKVRNRIVATTENGVFEYDPARDRFVPSAYFEKLLNIPNIRLMKEDGDGNIWFVHDKKVGVLTGGDRQQLVYLPELAEKLVNGFEHVYPIDAANVLVGAERGFFHVNLRKYLQQHRRLEVLLRTVRSTGRHDTLLFGGFGPAAGGSAVQVANHTNTLHFEFASAGYADQDNIEYAYRLRGLEKEWSAWSKRVDKEYPYLPAGNYVFELKARNSLGQESALRSYSFTVLPPWYRSWWAWGIYALFAAAGLLVLLRYQRRKFLLQQQRHEEEQRRLQYLHQLELEKNEKEIIRLQNEKLEAEIAHKNTQLASTAMHLVQKGEMLGKLRDELSRIRKKLDTEVATDDFKKVIRILHEEEKVDDDWDNFAQHFDQVHGNFLTVIKKEYPTLTPNELKLCAYLRMNLSSKEVAQLMNISVRGVEISRYRLRKKLGLATETNLFDFLIQIG